VITSNVIHRVFRLRYGEDEGTGFVVTVDAREYLITAKHVVEDIFAADCVAVFANGAWRELRVALVGHAPAGVDVSVLAADTRLAPPNLPLQATSDGLTYGQDVYFLGFPYGFCGRYIFGPDGYPLPFVKKGTVSLFDFPAFYLDGHNNPGFSGGPVVFAETTDGRSKVAGVISGYKAVSESVYEGERKTGLSYSYNTGIVTAYKIESAVALISANTIGLAVQDDA
jgi:hypothetical protein